MNPLLSLRELSAGYGKKAVIRDISIDIFAGEFCTLLGLNGSGKTTLLKAVCGLLPINGGRCLAVGLDCTRLSEKKRARYISYIPQRYSDLTGVTVIDAVLMGLNAKLNALESPSASDTAQALAALDKMEIGSLAGEDFSRLSEGQKQMVILTRTLVQNAPIMLMDEPDSALDFLNKHRILEKIRRLIHAEGKAGLAALHDPNLALAYSDRLIILHNSKIMSDIRLNKAGEEEIQSCLSAVYENIALAKLKGRYVVFY